jgi:hypothetical protein
MGNSKAEWTVMVYMVADSDDAFYQDAMDDILEMEKGLADLKPESDVRVLVQVDAPKPGEPQLCEVRKRKPNGESRILHLPCPDEIKAFDGKCLLDFVSFGIQSYPAERYKLILWGHGDGIDWKRRAFASRPVKGVGGGPQGELHLVDIRKVMEQLGSVLQGKKLVVGFDSCLMGMAEVYYEIRGNVSWVVATADEIPFSGWPYDKILAELVKDPQASTRTIVEMITTQVVESYDTRASDSIVSLSGSDLAESKCQKLIKAVGDLAACLKRHLKEAAVLRAIKAARREAEDYQEKAYMDLYCFCVKLPAALDREKVNAQEIKDAATTLRGALRQFVPVVKLSRDYPEKYEKLARAVNVCFPVTVPWKDTSKGPEPDPNAFPAGQTLRVDWEAYEKLAFNKVPNGTGGAGWKDFLMAFWKAVGRPDPQ